jgi:hypothetical protein
MALSHGPLFSTCGAREDHPSTEEVRPVAVCMKDARQK